jgi:DNA-binding XRE family transcriptional regulator
MEEKDALDELLEEGEADSPGFKVRVEAQTQARVILRRLIERRQQLRLSQADLAEKTGMQQSVIARLETGGRDPKLSTVLVYAAGVAMSIEALEAEAIARRPGRPRKSRVA